MRKRSRLGWPPSNKPVVMRATRRGYKVKPCKSEQNPTIGPLSPLVSSEWIRHQFDLGDEHAAKVAEAIHAAASGHVIRLFGRLIVTPAGDGHVNLELLNQ